MYCVVASTHVVLLCCSVLGAIYGQLALLTPLGVKIEVLDIASSGDIYDEIAETDSTGNFRLEGVPPGDYQAAMIAPDGLITLLGNITVQAEEITTVTLTPTSVSTHRLFLPIVRR